MKEQFLKDNPNAEYIHEYIDVNEDLTKKQKKAQTKEPRLLSEELNGQSRD